MPRHLTETERARAIAAAERYPSGHGYQWLAIPKTDKFSPYRKVDTLYHLDGHPEDIEHA